MNKYDEYYEFRYATIDDVDAIMKFIHDYWSENHILANDKDFFMYEFCNGNRVGYFLAIDKETKEIAAGWAIYYYTETFIPSESDVSSGMLYAKPNSKVPFLGVELMRRKFETLNSRAHVSPGVNMKTAGPLVKKWIKNDVSRLSHFYRLNDIDEYKIAKIQNKCIQEINEEIPQTDLTEVKTVEELYNIYNDKMFKNRRPYKDRWYIEKRYFNHPIYKYKVLVSSEQIVIVGREVEVNESVVFRIVDILGDVSKFCMLGKAIQKLIDDNNYEYVDLYELAMNPDDIIAAGFTERIIDDENTIPNYFEPYCCKNIEIYAHRSDIDTLCFKGDGDQDRPSHR
ncbi:MAG: hypothetical protein Q4D29_11315 [Lachnospiraceae bacterium]|nr:hypothetical protein [Lachnospiraceae bacterium]